MYSTPGHHVLEAQNPTVLGTVGALKQSLPDATQNGGHLGLSHGSRSLTFPKGSILLTMLCHEPVQGKGTVQKSPEGNDKYRPWSRLKQAYFNPITLIELLGLGRISIETVPD